jgi:hypothetical protein
VVDKAVSYWQRGPSQLALDEVAALSPVTPMKSNALLVAGIAIALAPRAFAGEPAHPYLPVGQAGSTCVKYLQARDAEAQARPPDAPPGRFFTGQYIVFIGLADGALSAANRLDSASPKVGANSTPADRMDWLENYCRDHTLEPFVDAVFSLREYLQKQ